MILKFNNCSNRSRLFARRCHLTEQIGARRRDLYANDIFISADDEIKHESSPTFPTNTSLCQQERKPIDSVISDSNSISQTVFNSTESAVKVSSFSSDDYTRRCRWMDLQCTRLSASELLSDEIHSSLISECSNPLVLPVFNKDKFLEEYFVLYHRYQVSEIIDKVFHSSILPMLELSSLDFSYKSVSAPLVSDILKLRELTKQLPPTHRALIVKLSLFVNHPLLDGYLKHVNAMSGIALPARSLSKSEHKSLCKSLRNTPKFGGLIESCFEDAYRMWLIRENTTSPEWKTRLSVSDNAELSQYTVINFAFKMAKFPQNNT